MGYRITIDRGNCINCGVCMDVCPVQALDMTRPDGRASRPAVATGGRIAWMMEYPVQVGECIGCERLHRRVPGPGHDARSRSRGPTPLLPRQGPVDPAVAAASGLGPALRRSTLESLKPNHPEPFEPDYRWRFADRGKPWPDVERTRRRGRDPRGALPDGLPGGHRRRPLRRADRRGPLRRRAMPWPPRSTPSRRSAAGSARRPARPPAVAARSTSRSPSARSSGSPRSAGTCRPSAAPAVKRAERVAIVGGGPAGMSAAYYLARLGYPVTVFEAMPVPGGMMAIGIPEYRLPRTVLREEIERIVGLGVELRSGRGHGPRLHARAISRTKATGRSSWPPARPRAAASAYPATTCRVSFRRRCSSRRSTSAEEPRL